MVPPTACWLHIAPDVAGSESYFGSSVPLRNLAVSVGKNRIYLGRTATDSMTGATTMYVDIYDGETYLLLDSLAVNQDPSTAVIPQIAVDDTRRRLYATSYSTVGDPAYFVKVYELDTGAFVTTIPLPNGIRGIAVNPVTGLLYLSSTSYSVMIVNPAAASVEEVQTGTRPWGTRADFDQCKDKQDLRREYGRGQCRDCHQRRHGRG